MQTTEPTRRDRQESLGIDDAGKIAELTAALNTAGDLPASDVDANAQSQPFMSLRVGDLGLFFPSDDGREVIAPPPVSRIPNTVSWLRGLANVRGELVPVVDAALAFGVARQPGVPVYLMIFGQADTAVGLLIDGLPRVFPVSTSERLAVPPVVPPLLTDSVIGAYEYGGRTWLEVDLDALFDTLARHVART